MMKCRRASLVLTILMAVACLAVNVAHADPEIEPRLLRMELTGLKANAPLSETLFSTTLIGQADFSDISQDSIGPFEAESTISAETQHGLPPSEQRARVTFYADLTAHGNAVLQIEGTIDLEKMVAELTSLRIDSSVLTATSSAKLKFASIGIIGSIRIEILPKTNLQSMTATLLWKNQTLTQNVHNASSPFTFQDLKSNSPEIPFEVNITSKDVGNMVFAIGTLKVDSEKVSMPFTVNYWNPTSIAGWNITFASAQYARESTLPIVIQGETNELANLPGAYTADFRENATAGSDQPPEENMPNNQTDWFQKLLATLSTPTSLSVIGILAVATVTIIAYKVRRHRIKSG